jgi:hypothetical protein
VIQKYYTVGSTRSAAAQYPNDLFRTAVLLLAHLDRLSTKYAPTSDVMAPFKDASSGYLDRMLSSSPAGRLVHFLMNVDDC